eukprot:13343495-Alexandrium_andersonii.AAC.1
MCDCTFATARKRRPCKAVGVLKSTLPTYKPSVRAVGALRAVGDGGARVLDELSAVGAPEVGDEA